MHTFNTLRFRGQSHIGVPPASAACGVDGHCFSPQSPGENIVEPLAVCQITLPSGTQWVSFRWFPKQPFPIFAKEASAGKKEWSPQWPHPKATEDPSIQKQSFARTVLVVAHTVLVVARLVLDVYWFCPLPVSARKRVFGPKTSRKRKNTGRKRAEKQPCESPMSPQKKNKKRGVRPPKSKPFVRVPFLMMRKVLNQG